MSRTYCVYILASRSRNLYIGVTNNLERRLHEHREGTVPGFTSRYKIFRLVYCETFGDVNCAIAREKEIKGWRREKKIWLIQRNNRTWEDLSTPPNPEKAPARRSTAVIPNPVPAQSAGNGGDGEGLNCVVIPNPAASLADGGEPARRGGGSASPHLNSHPKPSTIQNKKKTTADSSPPFANHRRQGSE